MCLDPILVEDLYESVNDREIRQVFEGQNRIHLEIKQLHRQLAMILDEQRRYVSVITDEVAKKGTTAESGQVSASQSTHFGIKAATQVSFWWITIMFSWSGYPPPAPLTKTVFSQIKFDHIFILKAFE